MADGKREVVRAIPLHQYVIVIVNQISTTVFIVRHGTLRGRAIAGASGQQEARIICHDLQAELVSIAGDYWLSDQIESEYWQKKVMISKAEESLHLEVLTI